MTRLPGVGLYVWRGLASVLVLVWLHQAGRHGWVLALALVAVAALEAEAYLAAARKVLSDSFKFRSDVLMAQLRSHRPSYHRKAAN